MINTYELQYRNVVDVPFPWLLEQYKIPAIDPFFSASGLAGLEQRLAQVACVI